MRRWLIVLGLALTLALAACSSKSELHFSNQTECGAATITLIHTASGQTSTHTVEQDQELTIEVNAEELYRYEVAYPRIPASELQCEAKTVETRVQPGQRINITLESVREDS